MEPSTTTGRKGSLANPEVREDVPGHVIPILQREFDDFDNEAEKFLATDDDLVASFGATSTDQVTVRGRWKYQSTVYSDQLIRVRVDVHDIPSNQDAMAPTLQSGIGSSETAADLSDRT